MLADWRHSPIIEQCPILSPTGDFFRSFWAVLLHFVHMYIFAKFKILLTAFCDEMHRNDKYTYAIDDIVEIIYLYIWNYFLSEV